MDSSAISGAANQAIHEAKPWLEKLARLGFVAKGVLYMTIGALATAAALRLGGTPATGSRGAMTHLLEAPFGEALLVVIAIGLFGYAAWRFVEGIADPEHHGTKPKGILKRARAIGVGVIHVALAISALKVAAGNLAAGNDGAQTQQATAKAMSTPGGMTALWLVAGGFVAYGLYQLYNAWRSKLDKRLALGQLSSRTRRIVVGASRFGIAARGVVFVTIGALLARGIQHRDPREARGIKAAMLELFNLGRWPFLTVAVGLVAYGVYQLINARYRRIAVA
jgi:hypothetical protein